MKVIVLAAATTLCALLAPLPTDGLAAVKRRESADARFHRRFSHLPVVDTVDVFRLTSIAAGPSGQIRCDDPAVICIKQIGVAASIGVGSRFTGAAAADLAAAWRALKPGGETACACADRLLRFYARGKMVLEATLCKDCGNAIFATDAIQGIRGDTEAYDHLWALINAATDPNPRATVSQAGPTSACSGARAAGLRLLPLTPSRAPADA